MWIYIVNVVYFVYFQCTCLPVLPYSLYFIPVSSGPRSLRQLSDSGMSGMDLSSIAEQVFEELSISDTDTLETSGCSDITSVSGQPPNNSASDVSMSLHFNISSPEEESLYELYRQILDWLDPETDLFVATPCRQHSQDKSGCYVPSVTMETPSLAVVLVLHEAEKQRLQQAQQFFSTRPWKFHHREGVVNEKTEGSDYNQDYYMLTPDRPLCSVRRVQCGKEHLRIVRYVTHKHWKDTLNLYKLILSQEPTVLKKDFCLFILNQSSQYDIQFGLKKLHKGMMPKKTRKCELYFRVSNIGTLVPLFPNVCHQVSDVRWCTKDFDGNRIYLQVPKYPKRCRSVSPSKLHAHYKKSAFSPVVPHKRKLHEDKESQVERSIIDKLSPRVYINRQVTSKLKPGSPLPTTPHSENSITNIRARPSSTSTPITSHSLPRHQPISQRSAQSLRSRPSSANELERRHSHDCVRTRPSSASTVLDEHESGHLVSSLESTSTFKRCGLHPRQHSQDQEHLLHLNKQSDVSTFITSREQSGHTAATPLVSQINNLNSTQTLERQSPYCFHSHTDSGFVDSTDSSFARDPRRTPIVGNQSSKLTSYPNIVELHTQTGTQNNTRMSLQTTNNASNKRSQIPDYCQGVRAGFPDNSGGHTIVSYKNSVKSRVESYIEDQNEMLGLGNTNKSNLSLISQYSAPQGSISHSNHADCVEEKPVILPKGRADQSQEKITNTLEEDNKNCDKHTGKSNEPLQCRTQSISPPVESNSGLHPTTTTMIQPVSPVVVDAANHDLQEYMKLCWGAEGDKEHAAFTSKHTLTLKQTPELKSKDAVPIVQQGHTSAQNTDDRVSGMQQQTQMHSSVTYVPETGSPEPDLQTASSSVKEPGASLLSEDRSSNLQPARISETKTSPTWNTVQDQTNTHLKPTQMNLENVIVSENAMTAPQKVSKEEYSVAEMALNPQDSVHNDNDTVDEIDNSKETATDSENTVTSKFTLGQFLNNNKVISEFLRKTSPDLAEQSKSSGDSQIHLPDLVQSNDCDFSRPVIYDDDSSAFQEDCHYKEAAVDVPQSFESVDFKQEDSVREGCPDDISPSTHPLKSCLPHRKTASLKRVKFSETNKHHFYEPLEWEEDIQDDTDYIGSQNQDLSPVTDLEMSSSNCVGPLDHQISCQTTAHNPPGCQPFRPLSTLQHNSPVSSLVAKFNSLNKQSDENHMQEPHDVHEGSKDIYQSQGKVTENSVTSTYTDHEWQAFKQQPQVGFYI